MAKIKKTKGQTMIHNTLCKKKDLATRTQLKTRENGMQPLVAPIVLLLLQTR